MRTPRHALAPRRHYGRATWTLIAAVAFAGVAPAFAADPPATEIEASNQAPVAKLSATNVWVPLYTVSADASASTDTDAWPITTYQFDFGDKTPIVTTTAPEAIARHTYAKTGKYKITLIVSDSAGKKSSSVSVSISVTKPPTDKPPTAKLKIVKPSGYGLTVTADGSQSTDTDATPIATYRFDFGDGTPAIETTFPVATVQHTYAAGGKYTVKLTATDTDGRVSSTVSSSVTVTEPPDLAPIAHLVVRRPSSTSLQVSADASGSSDDSGTPIGKYRFDFGDGTAPVVIDAPDATTDHTYASAGFYTVTLIVTDRGGHASTPVSVSVVAGEPPAPQVAVYVGYYDTHHPARTQPKPSPWKGASSVVFVGNADSGGSGWDSSCLRVENLTGSQIGGVKVTCDIGSKKYNLWGTNNIPGRGSLVLAQTSMENFDGSDTNPAGCYGCSPADCLRKISRTVPVVHVTIGGRTTDYLDPQQILNTRGVDGAGCPATGTRNDESHVWQQVSPAGAPYVVTSDPGLEYALPEGDHWMAAPYPNPAKTDVAFSFRTPSRGFVRLSVYDVSGRLIETPVDGSMEAGVHRVRVDLSRAAAGIYFCELQSSGGPMKKSFVVVR